MNEQRNKSILEKGNAAIAAGNNEGFLELCTDDTEWIFVGDKTLKGKEAIRQWMAKEYIVPPVIKVVNLVAEGDFLTAIGYLTIEDGEGKSTHYEYCDVWHFQDDRIAGLKAYVIEKETGY